MNTSIKEILAHYEHRATAANAKIETARRLFDKKSKASDLDKARAAIAIVTEERRLERLGIIIGALKKQIAPLRIEAPEYIQRCPSCGAPDDGRTAFCYHCGQRLADEVPQ